MKPFLVGVATMTTSILLSATLICLARKAMHMTMPETAHALLVEKVIPVPVDLKVIPPATDA